jgi:syndecan 4
MTNVSVMMVLKEHFVIKVKINNLEICKCSDHGNCIDGKCICKTGWSGLDCSVEICKDNCNGNGICIDREKLTGHCECDENYFGTFCEFTKCENCLHGKCDNKIGKCICEQNWSSDDCSIQTCPNDCNYNGICKNGECVCYDGFKGNYCETAICKNNCNYKGFCLKGRCHCMNGFYGEDCSKILN